MSITVSIIKSRGLIGVLLLFAGAILLVLTMVGRSFAAKHIEVPLVTQGGHLTVSIGAIIGVIALLGGAVMIFTAMREDKLAPSP